MPDILIGKLLLEAAQMMCTALHYYASHKAPDIPYGISHPHHPVCRWVRESDENFAWTARYANALALENYQRFRKQHASSHVAQWCYENRPSFPVALLTPFRLAMPDTYKVPEDPVASYRLWLQAKPYARTAKWSYPSVRPPWWSVRTVEDLDGGI